MPGLSSCALPNGAIISLAATTDDETGALLRTIPNPAPGTGDNFGASVATDRRGNIIVGAPSDDDAVDDSGVVFVFDLDTGALLRTIPNPFPASGDQFGSSVAADARGNIIVGAPLDSDPDGLGPIPTVAEAGSAFLFDRTTGELLHTLLDPDRGVTDLFGWSVAAGGGDIVVGAIQEAIDGKAAGAAFVFDAKKATLLRTIANPFPASGDRFGWSVAVDGSSIMVGAPWDDDPDGPGPIPEVVSGGAVFAFDEKTGALARTIANPSAAPDDWFGSSVAIDRHGTIIVGAPLDDDPDGPGPLPDETDAGTVFLFK